MSKYRLILFTMFFLSFAANLVLSQELNKSKDWVKELKELSPLPKIHYSWPLPAYVAIFNIYVLSRSAAPAILKKPKD